MSKPEVKAVKGTRLRTTIVVESENQADLEEALTQGVAFAKAHYMGVSFGSKKPDGPRVSVRTTTMRKPREVNHETRDKGRGK